MSEPGLFDIRDKVFLITGSTRGIGKAIAMHAAAAGARVVISSRKPEACDAVRLEIEAAGGEACAIPCHIGRREQVEALVGGTLERFGQIDALVCNAAVNPHYGPLGTLEDQAFDRIMASNVRSNIWLANLALPGMAKRGGGAMILLSSVAGLRGCDTIGAYGISKAADIALAKNLAVEWGPSNIRVNAICPGIVKTDFAQALWESEDTVAQTIRTSCLKRLAEPDDIAGVALFLASPAARYITGTAITVDGGATASIVL